MAVELRAERVAAGGDAIAREPGGRVVFVPGALPGELVRVRMVASRRDYARAVVEAVLEPSPARVGAPCPFVAAGCGGCTWQHVDPAAQVRLKVAIVEEALRRTGGLPGAVVEAGPALDPWGFRTTLRLGVDADGRPGFRVRRGHTLVPVGRCLVAHPRLDGLLAGLRLPGAREVVLRCSAARGERAASVDPPASAAAAVGFPPDLAVGPGAAVHEEIAGAPLRVSMASFFQSRADGAAALVAVVGQALASVPDGSTVVDAYAGVGLFAGTVGRRHRVVAVERHRAACRDARRNLAATGARVVEADIERWPPVAADAVVADPARRGLGRRAVEVLAGTGAARLVLVSCDPVSLARDAALLGRHGFAHERSTVVDLFPHTPHVEVVTSLVR